MSLDTIDLVLVFLAALGGGWVARRLNYPSILGELVAGIVLGPPLLGLLKLDDGLSVIGKLGVILLMLYIGLHLDPSALGKAAKPGALAALGGFVVPAALGFGLMMLVNGDPIAAVFVAVAMGVTSLATKSRILVDLGILNTRVAHVLMAGALFSDIAALIVFAALLGFAATGTLAVGGLAATALQAVLFGVVALVLGVKVFPWVGGRLLSGRKIESSTLFLGVVAVGLAFAALADAVELHGILGAFLAGLFIREGVLNTAQLADVEHKMRTVSVGLLAPVFFVTAGFQVSFSIFSEAPGLLIAIIVLATVGKVIGTALFYLPTGYGFREGVTVGAGMNGRGAVEIIVAELALEAGIIDETVFSILVFMAIFTTATVPVLLTRSVEWLRSRGELVADERSGVVIVGAGPLARQLALLLDDPSQITMIDTNTEHCDVAADLGLAVIKGSGLDDAVLAEAGADDARSVVAVTGNAEVNLLTGRIAARWFGVPELHVAFTHESTSSMRSELEEMGGAMLFGHAVDLTSWDVDVDRGLTGESVSVVTDPDGFDLTAVGDADAADPSASLPMVIRRDSKRIVYSSAVPLRSGDEIVFVTRRGNPTESERNPTLSSGAGT